MDKTKLVEFYLQTRALSLSLCEPLSPEVFRLQPMADVSPPWWNLGHTSWFFAQNILASYGKATKEDKLYDYLLNSYYETFGERIAREDRGKVSSPTTSEIYEYRKSVDDRMLLLIEETKDGFSELYPLIYIGLQHEQQHQELLVTEIKNILSYNPLELRPIYHKIEKNNLSAIFLDFLNVKGGLFSFGNAEGGWCWDNELGVHKAYLEDFAIANRLINNGEYLEFIEAGGYNDALSWLSDGWHVSQKNIWDSPLYWKKINGVFHEWSLNGLSKLDYASPVCHISFYEAHAFAEWKSKKENKKFRLPTEREWEHVARSCNIKKQTVDFLEGEIFHPSKAIGNSNLEQMYGGLWEWTTSHYEPYPRFETLQGALAEYNGKFMNNQRVLRGGSCATPKNHIRISYRNFWEASTRFQFTGIRLVEDYKK